MPPLVHAARTPGLTTLTLDSPANRNALSATLVEELRTALATAAAEPSTRAVVLTHTGTTFCAGADLKSPCDPADFLALLREIAELSKPVVARVTGHVRAGGLGLLGVCDIAAAGQASTYAFTETHLGVVPAVISAPLLPRLDPRAAARYFLTAEVFDAAEATRIGLLTLHTPDADVDKVLAPVLEGLLKAGPEALAATKRLVTAPVRAALERDGAALTELSARHFASAEAREGISARFERRDPSWLR
ncbi:MULTISPECIES: enoyl-CoA hydratase family protein [unclassified Streptomyces]|uniref:enoyl-CoA hydratase family protein n=1 Tax=unclassified Streptomyces TaxID=2593676 RepID=UPI002030CED4|nr:MULTISPECIES: enoyl-CoA hydratase family protein [unclassified Streptomyces]MCM1973312.1 enoyl-CoA hydratase family protein [Streptomyces sp. G1]MCX5124414.1 enoyl-CoA hydratase family protein [Streptomyces sp. NBC_00347]MCX5297661.1 enoyl-CoA hydratase family protein [Streptomyces sp. NBC_00193]